MRSLPFGRLVSGLLMLAGWVGSVGMMGGCRGSIFNPKSDIELRFDAADAISNPPDRDNALADVAVSSASQGDGRLVLRVLPKINDPRLRDAASDKSVDALLRIGERNAANKVATSIVDRSLRDAVLKRLAGTVTSPDPALADHPPSALGE